MKKKIIILGIVCLLFIIGIIVLLNSNKKEKIYTTITLDINPSMEINLDKNDKVISVVALNDDAKDIINNDFKGMPLDDTIELITSDLIDNGFVEDNFVEIILYVDGNIKSEDVERKILNSFDKKQISTNIIVVESITEEDKKLAKEYNTSPAKISYIKTITEDNKNISIEDFSNKPVREIVETKRTGRYCDQGYTLEGDWCIKEIETVAAKTGEICPHDYLDYEGTCYETSRIEDTDTLLCRDEYNLEGKECIKNTVIDAVVTGYSCPVGEVRTRGEIGEAPYESGPAKETVCVDSENITHPVTICELPASDPTERISYGGRCYWHRAPVIESGCPGKIEVDGFCWDDASGIYLCPNNYNSNPRTADDNCYVVLDGVYPVPSSYRCDEEDMVLEGDKCVRVEKEEAFNKRKCSDGYTLIENDKCLNFDKTAPKEEGYVCEEENSRLNGNKCIIYDMVLAKKN